jgi:hypothetical protein
MRSRVMIIEGKTVRATWDKNGYVVEDIESSEYIGRVFRFRSRWMNCDTYKRYDTMREAVKGAIIAKEYRRFHKR